MTTVTIRRCNYCGGQIDPKSQFAIHIWGVMAMSPSSAHFGIQFGGVDSEAYGTQFYEDLDFCNANCLDSFTRQQQASIVEALKENKI